MLRYSHTVGFYAVQGGRGFNLPVDVALGGEGRMYVLNRTGPDIASRAPYKRITLCTVDEEFIRDIGNGGGTGDGQFMWPVSVALDRDENVYVSDEALHRISVFDREGRFITRWGVRGDGDGEFDRPAGIVLDREDNLLVADGLNHRIQRYTKEGRFLGGWGGHGTADGEFNNPWGINVDGAGNVYVADWRNDRIQKFDPDGQHLATWGTSGDGDGQFHRPAGVGVDGDGDVYVADWGNERVQVLSPEGRFIDAIKGDAGLSKWAEEYYATEQDELAERLKSNMEPEIEPRPGYVHRDQSAAVEKLFWGPTSVKVDDQDRIYVLDSCRYRVQIYVKEKSAVAGA